MSSKTLLLISNQPEDQAFASEVAITAGLSFKQTADPAQGVQVIAQEEPAIIFADTSSEEQYEKLESNIQSVLGLFSDKVNSNSIHFISSQELDKVPYLMKSPLFGHFIQRNYKDPKAAGAHYGQIVKATLNERAFGLSQLLKQGTKIQVVKLTVSNQKHDAVEAVKAFLIAAKFQGRMAAVIANAVDEILLNAIFDAPVDEGGKSIHSRTARSTVLQLVDQNAVEMHLGFDGNYVAISAIDHHGSLDRTKLVTHISKIYTQEEYQLRTTVANAGIGLATVFQTGGSFFFSSESRVRTEVTVFFKRTPNFREFKDQFKFISTQFYF